MSQLQRVIRWALSNDERRSAMLRSGWMDLLTAGAEITRRWIFSSLEVTRTRRWIGTTLEQEAGNEWIITAGVFLFLFFY